MKKYIIPAGLLLYFVTDGVLMYLCPECYESTGSLLWVLLYLAASIIFTAPLLIPVAALITIVIHRKDGENGRAYWNSGKKEAVISLVWAAVIIAHLLIPTYPFRQYELDGKRQGNIEIIKSIVADMHDGETVVIDGLSLDEDKVVSFPIIRSHNAREYDYYSYMGDHVPFIFPMNWEQLVNEEMEYERLESLTVYKHSGFVIHHTAEE